MIRVITTRCTRSTANSEAGGCTRGAHKVPPTRHPVGGGGKGAYSLVAHTTARVCHRPGSHAPLPAPGRSDNPVAPRPTTTPPTGSLTPLTMLAGEGVAQVSWLLGSNASRSHSSGHGLGRLGESPAHAKTTRSPPGSRRHL